MELLAGSQLAIDVADPHVPGAGRIWRPDQSPMLLMNSHAEDVSVFTDDSVECAGPARPGPDLHQWARSVSAGEIALPDVDDDLRKEIAGLQPKSFASRRLLSKYLSWFYATTVADFPDSVTVTPHTQLVTSVTPDGQGYRAELADGTVRVAEGVVRIAEQEGSGAVGESGLDRVEVKAVPAAVCRGSREWHPNNGCSRLGDQVVERRIDRVGDHHRVAWPGYPAKDFDDPHRDIGGGEQGRVLEIPGPATARESPEGTEDRIR